MASASSISRRKTLALDLYYAADAPPDGHPYPASSVDARDVYERGERPNAQRPIRFSQILWKTLWKGL